MLKGGFVLLSLFLNWQNTSLDVGRSKFDVRRSFFSKSLTRATSFLAADEANSAAPPAEHLKPSFRVGS